MERVSKQRPLCCTEFEIMFSQRQDHDKIEGSYSELPFDSLDEILVDEMGVLPSGLDLLGQLVLVPNEARKRIR